MKPQGEPPTKPLNEPWLSADVGLRRGEFDLQCEMRLTAPITALFGASGSGKSTLLQVLCGLLRPQRGRVALADRVLDDVAAGEHVATARRRVGMVFQDLRLLPRWTVEQNLLFGWRRCSGAVRSASSVTPGQVVEALELSALLDRRPDELSGGERQRVALGRSLLALPEVLLMDEPLASVDWTRRRRILPYLRWVQESLQIPILYVSHTLPEILELTDQVVVMEAGRVTEQGEVFEVLGGALHGAHAETVATESLLPVRVTHCHEEGWHMRALVGDQELFLPFDPGMSPGHQGRVAVRPQDVMLAQDRLVGVSARNQVTGQVARVTSLHGRLLVHVEVGPGAVLRAELTRDAMAELGVEVGRTVVCVVKTSAFRWL